MLLDEAEASNVTAVFSMTVLSAPASAIKFAVEEVSGVGAGVVVGV